MTRIAYVVSRFPIATEIFIVRELNGVDASPGLDTELFSLFPPKDAFVHEAAARWVPLARHGRLAAGLRALGWWGLRRPRRLAGALATVLGGYGPSPNRTLRALVTFALAAAHARTMRDLRVDHVHAHFANWPAMTAWVCGQLLDKPYSFTAHAHDIFVDQANLDRLVEDAAFVATISEYNRVFLAGVAPRSATPVHVVHCGVDLARFAFAARRPPDSGPVRLLCIGALQEKKGHAVLLDALSRPLPGFERFVLDLVGGGELEAPLRATVERLGLSDRVRFHGERSEVQVAEHLAAADALVLPSIVASSGQMEGLPVAVLEALASGVPVVSTALSGMPELLQQDATCLLTTPGDATGLCVALRSLLTDPDAATRRARAGRAIVEREFGIDRTVEQMVELFGATPATRGADPGSQAGHSRIG